MEIQKVQLNRQLYRIKLFPILILFPDFMRDFLLKSRIRFFFSKADDLSNSYINIDARITLEVERKINEVVFFPQISSKSLEEPFLEDVFLCSLQS